MEQPTTPVRLLVWLPMHVGAGLLGRLTVDDGALALVWPAAGVAVLWLATATRRSLAWDVAALVTSIAAINLATGVRPGLTLLLVVTGLVQAGVFVWSARRYAGQLHVFGGTRRLATLHDLATVVAISLAACAVGAGVGALGLALLGDGDGLDVVTWWGRNAAGVVVVVVLGLLLLHHVAQRTGRLPSERSPRPTARAIAEGVGLWLLAVLVVTVVFAPREPYPLTFLLVFVTVLSAVRLSPLAVTFLGLAIGVVAVVFTAAGRGPLSVIEDPVLRAVVTQGFVLLTALSGLVLAFGRHERNEALARLAASERETAQRARLLSSMLEQMHEGVAVIDADGQVVVRNAAGDRLLGQQLESELHASTASSDYGMLHLDGSPVRGEQMPYVRACGGEPVREDFLLVRPDSDVIVMEVSASPMPGEPGTPPQALVTFRDVTAERQDRDTLATFAGVVAHDLKRPLSVAAGWAGVLHDELHAGPVAPAEALDMLTRVLRSTDQMGRLIDDLLDYAVVRDAQVDLRLVDLSAAAHEVAAEVSVRETSPKITVEPGLRAHADPVMVRQILGNLIGNATTYVAPGVRPQVHVAGRTEEPWTVLTVADNGIGVPVGQREQIFGTFQRAHAQDYSGTGLGLAIVRRAAERCGGRVVLRESSERGSTFEVRLPAPGDAGSRASGR